MKISILTLFPDMFKGPFEHSILKHAQQKGAVEIEFVDIREFGIGSHKMVDDTPYGGGIGMVMRVDVLHQAIEHTKQAFIPTQNNKENIKQLVVLMSASGKKFTQQTAKQYSHLDHLIIICGHYEGVDARISSYIDAEICIGDFVLTGGEIPAMLITDAITRLIPGVLKEGVTQNESFSLANDKHITLEYPHYTKPAEYKGEAVPEVLTSGNHKLIDQWRTEQAQKRTEHIRPDLLKE